MGQPPERVSILIVDDNDSSAIWDARFQEDAQRRAGDGGMTRMFERYGDVCRTAQAGRALLLRAFKEHLPPDLVLIDQVLSTGTVSRRREAAGLDGVMRWLRDECQATNKKLPTCVLWTASYDPGLAFAFIDAGGRHAFSRELPAEELLEQLWLVHDGHAQWEHRWAPPKLELTPKQLLVMPYFEANLPTHEIAARMLATGEIDVARDKAEDWVNQRRGDIMERANAICDQTGESRFEGRGLSVALARFAVKHGNLWIPLAYRE